MDSLPIGCIYIKKKTFDPSNEKKRCKGYKYYLNEVGSGFTILTLSQNILNIYHIQTKNKQYYS
jgi:hypothetical protein